MTLSRSLKGCRRIGMGSAIAAAALAAALTVSSNAHAQSASDKAAAEALFDQGVKLLKAGDFAEACKKLESSQKIDPGIGTLLYLADCYKKAGRTASAWATFREASSKAKAAGEDDRARIGMENADKLESVLSRLTIHVAEANLEIEGLEIQEDGNAVNRALWGSAVPVNPGQLRVMAKAPGYEPFETQITIQKGPANAEISVPALVALPEEEEPAAVPEDSAPSAAVSATPEDMEPASSTQATVGLILAGTGVVGLGVGGVFGMLAINKNDEAKELCGDSTTCPFESGGEAATDQAKTNALISTIGMAAGGVLLAGGAILYFTAPSGEEVAKISVTPTAGGAHFGFGGTF